MSVDMRVAVSALPVDYHGELRNRMIHRHGKVVDRVAHGIQNPEELRDGQGLKSGLLEYVSRFHQVTHRAFHQNLGVGYNRSVPCLGRRLEVIAFRGEANRVRSLARTLQSRKEVVLLKLQTSPARIKTLLTGVWT